MLEIIPKPEMGKSIIKERDRDSYDVGIQSW